MVIIGPRFSKNNYGGIVVLFENLINNSSSNCKYNEVIDSNSKNYSNKFTMIFHVIIRLFFNWGKHASLHGTEVDFRIIGAILLLRKRMGGGEYSLRKFAGNYDEYFKKYSVLQSRVACSVLKESYANFFETKYLVEKFSIYNTNTFWFPNVRPSTTLRSVEYKNDEIFKVIYLSQVRQEKGILDLIDSLSNKNRIELTIAGPIIDDVINPDDLPENIDYIGEIDPADAYEIMSKHHLLALPTFYSGEGYPGVIIESFMLGLPILTTKWRSLPELVEDAGVLVMPESPFDILKSVMDMRDNTHKEYKDKSYGKSKLFSDVEVTSYYWSCITSH